MQAFHIIKTVGTIKIVVLAIACAISYPVVGTSAYPHLYDIRWCRRLAPLAAFPFEQLVLRGQRLAISLDEN